MFAAPLTLTYTAKARSYSVYQLDPVLSVPKQRVVAAWPSCPAARRLSLPVEKGVGRSVTRLRVSARWTNAGGDSWAETAACSAPYTEMI